MPCRSFLYNLITWHLKVMGVFSSLGPVIQQYIFTLLLTPVSFIIIPLLKTRRANILFHFLSGLAVCVIVYKNNVIYPIMLSLIGYLIMKFRPWHTFAIAFLLNSFMHWYLSRNSSKQWTLSVTGIIMVIVEKIISTSFNLDDAKKQDKSKRSIYSRFELKERPSFSEWLAFCFTPYGSTTGPFYEFKVFSWMLDNGTREQKPLSKEERTLLGKSLFWALAAAAITMISTKWLNYSVYSKPIYLESNVAVKSVIIIATTIAQVYKYFCVWNAVDAGLIALHIEQCPYVENRSYSNLFFHDVLFSMDCGTWMQNWNHSTHLFFKRYLFLRLKDSGFSYTFSHITVFIASPFWHGFRPSYYLVIPELMVAMWADKRLLRIWPKEQIKSSFGRLLRGVWVAFVNLGATSTWWQGTFAAFYYIRQTSNWVFLQAALGALGLSFVVGKAPGEKPPKIQKNQ